MENGAPVEADLYCPVGGADIDGVVYKKDEIKLVNKQNTIKLVKLESRKIKEGSAINLGCIIRVEDLTYEGELERMRLDFVSMSVHVLRTPISVIKGYLSFLSKPETTKKLDETEIQYLNQTITSVDELVDLVENLLDLSGLQKGGFELKTSAISLEKIIKDVVDEYKQAAKEKELKLIFAPPLFEIPLVEANVTRLKIVLRNLIGNAVKFTDKGQIEISLHEEKDGFITVSIKDTGKGIPAENIDKVFDKFYRIKEALEMASGAGLGLFISKKIIESLQGKIWVESVEGKGSTFYFSIPISIEARN